jgi:hypothetical protein
VATISESGRDRDQRVAGPAGELRSQRLAGRDCDRRRLVGQRVEARLFDFVELAAERLVAALPERADDFDRLLEHVEPLVGRRPALAHHVLVQVLTRA